MRNKIIKNPGLMIVSIVSAFLLWLVVVNVDDPVINRTYTGIPVEILNEDVIAQEGKCYEVIGGTDTITVVISAKRSVLDDMSRDYIRATADLKEMTFLDTVPIEVKITRYADAIESVNNRTESLKLSLENVVKRTVPLRVETEGQVAAGYLLSTLKPKYDSIVVVGPESEVKEVTEAVCVVDIDGMNADESVFVPIELYNESGHEIEEKRITKEIGSVSVNVVVWGTKEIPVTCQASGFPADGYSIVGSTIVEPSSVVITGRSAFLSSMSNLTIPSDMVSVAGATDSIVTEIDLSKFLPEGISFAENGYDGKAVVSVDVEANDRKIVDVPTSNITIENVPEGYKATLVDVGGSIAIEVQGKGDTFDRFDGTLAIGTIDALSLVPRDGITGEAFIYTGANDGRVVFTLPAGVSETTPVYMEVIVELAALEPTE